MAHQVVTELQAPLVGGQLGHRLAAGRRLRLGYPIASEDEVEAGEPGRGRRQAEVHQGGGAGVGAGLVGEPHLVPPAQGGALRAEFQVSRVGEEAIEPVHQSTEALLHRLVRAVE